MDKTFKVLKIEHVAIAVRNNKSALGLFELLGMDIGKKEFVKDQKVNVVKIRTESRDHAIELLEASDDSSIIKKFIDKNGEGLHHIALEVDNIKAAISYLKNNGVELIYDSPKLGANDKLITFISPKSTPGILLELCQSL